MCYLQIIVIILDEPETKKKKKLRNLNIIKPKHTLESEAKLAAQK